jgi:hypothetical protein
MFDVVESSSTFLVDFSDGVRHAVQHLAGFISSHGVHLAVDLAILRPRIRAAKHLPLRLRCGSELNRKTQDG